MFIFIAVFPPNSDPSPPTLSQRGSPIKICQFCLLRPFGCHFGDFEIGKLQLIAFLYNPKFRVRHVGDFSKAVAWFPFRPLPFKETRKKGLQRKEEKQQETRGQDMTPTWHTSPFFEAAPGCSQLGSGLPLLRWAS